MISTTAFIILLLAIGYLVIVYGLLWLAQRTERRSRPQG